jgi:hypothetical protein
MSNGVIAASPESCFDQESAKSTKLKLLRPKCLSDPLKPRKQKIKKQNGFESEKRRWQNTSLLGKSARVMTPRAA